MFRKRIYEIIEKAEEHDTLSAIYDYFMIVVIIAKFTEADDNPDVGEVSKQYTVTREDISNGFTVTMDLYVTENGGRNSGKSAHFIVSFKFTPQ